MTATYKISAKPSFYSAGEYQGKLKSVTFTAISPIDSRQWPAKNCGQFEAAFSKVMGKDLASLMVAALSHGDDVELPGLYEEHQFDQGFLFEWSPVYLVLPPIFFFSEEKTA